VSEPIPVTVVDLGLGNLGSVLQALRRAGGAPSLSSGPRAIAKASRIVLPGVAAFGLGMERADQLSLKPALEEALARQVPLLGICLGMQILFEEGDEDGTRPGLGLLPGRVTKLPASVSVPHIGWQQLVETGASPLLAASREPQAASRPWAYFAHSYRCEAPADVTRAIAEHAPAAGGEPVRIAAVVQRGNVHGVQFHPEKSARDGQQLLSRFLALSAGAA
jgi:glutamine amidotransferase